MPWFYKKKQNVDTYAMVLQKKKTKYRYICHGFTKKQNVDTYAMVLPKTKM